MKKFIFISLLLCCSLSAWSELKYLEITSLQGAPQVQVGKIEDIQFLVDYHKIEIGYLLKTSEKVQLILMAEGSYFTFDLDGYDSIDTYLAGRKGGFKNGVDYNEAVHLGLAETDKPDSTLFYFYKRNTFKSVEDCKDAYKKGYAFLEEPKKESEKTQSQQGKSAESQAYYKGERAQLANYKEFCEFNPGLEQGYKTKADILDARKKGFESVRGYEYYMAMERGFSKYEDYKAASDLGLESKENYDRYNKIVKEVESIEKRQKVEKNDAFTYFYLCQIPKGQQSSEVLLKTLEDLYQKQDKQVQVALDLYLSEIPSLTEWDKEKSPRSRSGKYRYRSASPYLSKNTLVDFFKRVDVSRIGNFDEDADIFTRNGSHFIQLAKNKPIPSETKASDVGVIEAMKWLGGNTSYQAVIPVSQEYGTKREVLDWYTSLGQISTKTSDEIPASVIVEVVLGYKQADKATSTEIAQYQIEIKNYLRDYFSQLTVEDLRPRNEEERRLEIKKEINRKILKDSEIRDVRFLSLQIIEQ